MDEQIREIAAKIGATAEDVFRYLDSPSGRKLRRMLATGLIVSAPLVMRMPGLKRSPIGRAIELFGGAALVVKIAGLIRDWERAGA
jgi:hypothetical protein